jgi:hypothetical protein
MSQKTVVADAVATAFSLSAEMAESISVAAELAMDSAFDFSKSCDSIAATLVSLKSADLLTFASWTVVADQFKAVAEVRARDNGAADPKGAAGDCWERVVKRNKEIHGLSKPKSENPEAQDKAAKREAEKAKLVAQAQGRTAEDLKATVKTLYGEATDESIAQAKALEKVVKAVEAVEKDSVSAQMKPLLDSAQAQHKAIIEFMKAKNDPKLLGDYVVLLKRTLDIWKSQ